MKQRAARSEEVRRVVEEASKKVAELGWSLWRGEGLPAAVQSAIAEADAIADATAFSLNEERLRVAPSLTSVRPLLGELQDLLKSAAQPG